MHRATPLNSSFRSFTAGGTRSAVDTIDDTKLMQEHSGNFMHGETRQGIEAPQNYGFTSVVMPAVKDALGKISDSAEAMISFMGGNRSFPVAGVMDDRRHRLFGLEHGDTAMFRTAADQLQLHMTGDGGFWSGPQDKTVRLQLVAKQQQQQGGGSSGGGGSTKDASGGGGGGGSQQGSGQQKGQKPVYKNGQTSDFFVHITQDGTMASGKNVYLRQGTSFGGSGSSGGSGGSSRTGVEAFAQTNNVLVHVADDKNVYLGGKKGDPMRKVLLEGGVPAKNVWGMPGGSELDIAEGTISLEPDIGKRTTLLDALIAKIDALTARIDALEARRG